MLLLQCTEGRGYANAARGLLRKNGAASASVEKEATPHSSDSPRTAFA